MSKILLETGDALLLEDGSYLLDESSSGGGGANYAVVAASGSGYGLAGNSSALGSHGVSR